MTPAPLFRPTAIVTLEPTGRRGSAPRRHVVTLTLRLTTGDSKYGDKVQVASFARRALEAVFPASTDGTDRRRIDAVSTKIGGKVISIEGAVPWPDAPSRDRMGLLRDELLAEGYNVGLSEMRECSEAECGSETLTDWTIPTSIPVGWFSDRICGKHSFRSCAACKSKYRMTSTNTVHAPSLRCEVCDVLMIEWGGSKIWHAELMVRGTAA